MPLVIETNTFIDFIDTLASTSGKDRDDVGEDGVFIYPARGAVGDEPGVKDLVAGLSTNGRVSAHYYRSCDSNTGFKPTFWPGSVLGLVAAAFGPRAAAAEGDHIIEVKQVGTDTVEVTEYGQPSDVKVSFKVQPADDFPHAGVVRLLKGKSPGEPVARDELPVTDGSTELWDMATLGHLLRVAKSWKTRLVVEKTVTGKVCKVAMEGVSNWAGAVVPPVPEEAATLNGGAAAEVFLTVPSADVKK